MKNINKKTIFIIFSSILFVLQSIFIQNNTHLNIFTLFISLSFLFLNTDITISTIFSTIFLSLFVLFLNIYKINPLNLNIRKRFLLNKTFIWVDILFIQTLINKTFSLNKILQKQISLKTKLLNKILEKLINSKFIKKLRHITIKTIKFIINFYKKNESYILFLTILSIALYSIFLGLNFSKQKLSLSIQQIMRIELCFFYFILQIIILILFLFLLIYTKHTKNKNFFIIIVSIIYIFLHNKFIYIITSYPIIVNVYPKKDIQLWQMIYIQGINFSNFRNDKTAIFINNQKVNRIEKWTESEINFIAEKQIKKDDKMCIQNANGNKTIFCFKFK